MVSCFQCFFFFFVFSAHRFTRRAFLSHEKFTEFQQILELVTDGQKGCLREFGRLEGGEGEIVFKEIADLQNLEDLEDLENLEDLEAPSPRQPCQGASGYVVVRDDQGAHDILAGERTLCSDKLNLVVIL